MFYSVRRMPTSPGCSSLATFWPGWRLGESSAALVRELAYRTDPAASGRITRIAASPEFSQGAVLGGGILCVRSGVARAPRRSLNGLTLCLANVTPNRARSKRAGSCFRDASERSTHHARRRWRRWLRRRLYLRARRQQQYAGWDAARRRFRRDELRQLPHGWDARGSRAVEWYCEQTVDSASWSGRSWMVRTASPSTGMGSRSGYRPRTGEAQRPTRGETSQKTRRLNWDVI